MTDPSGHEAVDSWVRSVAEGCTQVATLLIGCGGVCYGVLLVGAFGVARVWAGYSDLYAVLTHPWFILWSVVYWLSALGLLTGGLGLRRPKEFARTFLDRTSLALIMLWAAAFGATGGLLLMSAVASGESIVMTAETLMSIAPVVGLPTAIAVAYLWQLRNALWSRAMIETCCGEAPEDWKDARRAMNWRARYWMVGAMAAAGLIAARWSWLRSAGYW